MKRMKIEALRAANQRFREQEQAFFRELLELGVTTGALAPMDTARTAALIQQLKATPHLAISGRMMEFDGKGKCVAGC